MAKSEKKDENGMGEPITATHPDPIPPVHVLEAAQDQEKKETEDLLAGFDRPGRGPKKPEGERDFVEYFAKKAGATPTPPPVRAAVSPPRPKQVDIETVVVPRNKKTGVGTWLLAAAVMLGLGGMVAFFATRDDAKTSSVGSATTITSTSPPPSTRSSHDDIPPPPPASEVSSAPAIDPPATTDVPATAAATNAAPPSSAPKKRDPKNAGSASGSSAAAPNATTPVTSTGGGPAPPSSKPPPRDDFLRGM